MITHESIEEAAFAIMAKAAIDIPEDYFNGIKAMIDVEKGDLSTFVSGGGVEAVHQLREQEALVGQPVARVARQDAQVAIDQATQTNVRGRNEEGVALLARRREEREAQARLHHVSNAASNASQSLNGTYLNPCRTVSRLLNQGPAVNAAVS